MTRIETTFARLGAARKKALVAFVCVGDPTVETSLAVAKTCIAAGADVLELGVPFSDPIADGPVIARAGARAIAAGSSLAKVLSVARALRASSEVPLVLFSYFNPVFTYGAVKLAADAANAGIDALLLVDLPSEEGDDLRAAATKNGLAMIPLLSPTTTAARATRSLSRASGFVYYVSVTGVTGSSAAPLADAPAAAEKLRTEGKLPVVVGFGIDSPEKAVSAAGPRDGGADGVVVGTAIVRAIELAASEAEACVAVGALVAGIRAALDR